MKQICTGARRSLKTIFTVLVFLFVGLTAYSEDYSGAAWANHTDISDSGLSLDVAGAGVSFHINWRVYSLMGEPVEYYEAAWLLPDRVRITLQPEFLKRYRVGNNLEVPRQVLDKIRIVELVFWGTVGEANGAWGLWMDPGAMAKPYIYAYSAGQQVQGINDFRRLSQDRKKSYMSFNSAGSPDWNNLFVNNNGSRPGYPDEFSKELMKRGFSVGTGREEVLLRRLRFDLTAVREWLLGLEQKAVEEWKRDIQGREKDLETKSAEREKSEGEDFWNTVPGMETVQDRLEREAVEKEKLLIAEAERNIRDELRRTAEQRRQFDQQISQRIEQIKARPEPGRKLAGELIWQYELPPSMKKEWKLVRVHLWGKYIEIARENHLYEEGINNRSLVRVSDGSIIELDQYFPKRDKYSYNVRFSPSGGYLVLHGERLHEYIWKFEQDHISALYHNDIYLSDSDPTEFSSDDRYIAFRRSKGVFETASQRVLAKLPYPDLPTHYYKIFSADSAYLLIYYNYSFRYAEVYHLPSGQRRARLEKDDCYNYFIAAGPYFAGFKGSTVCLLRCRDLSEVQRITIRSTSGQNAAVSSVTSLTDGSSIFVSTRFGDIIKYESSTGKELVRFNDGSGKAYGDLPQNSFDIFLYISPDGRMIASDAQSDGTGLRIWDTATGKLLFRLSNSRFECWSGNGKGFFIWDWREDKILHYR